MAHNDHSDARRQMDRSLLKTSANHDGGEELAPGYFQAASALSASLHEALQGPPPALSAAHRNMLALLSKRSVELLLASVECGVSPSAAAGVVTRGKPC